MLNIIVMKKNFYFICILIKIAKKNIVLIDILKIIVFKMKMVNIIINLFVNLNHHEVGYVFICFIYKNKFYKIFILIFFYYIKIK